jgi:histidinol-phosphate aminotransferase
MSNLKSPTDLLRPEIAALSAYHVPPAGGFIKLDAMENPYPLPAALRDKLAALAHDAALNRYPDPSGAHLKTMLRQAMSVPEGAEILLGNGSDEIIQILAMALARPGAVMLGLEPSFVMYRMIASFAGMRFAGVPLRADFTLDTPALLAAIEQEQPALIFIAYPNNPTANLFPAEDLKAVLAAARGVVVIDEAYHAFARESFMGMLPQYPNLLVMRTLSKIGLAALRLGFLAGAPQWLGQLEKLRLPYNINSFSQAAAVCVLGEPAVLREQADAIVMERERMQAALSALPGVTVFPSQANFILLRVADAPRVFEGMKARGVLIKNLHGAHPLLAQCLRITIGSPQENAALLAALAGLLDTH